MAEKKYFDKLTKLEFCDMIGSDFQAEYEVKDSVCELEPCEVVIPRTASLRPRWFYLDGKQVDFELIFKRIGK